MDREEARKKARRHAKKAKRATDPAEKAKHMKLARRWRRRAHEA